VSAPAEFLRRALLAASLAAALGTASCSSLDSERIGLSEAPATRDDIAADLPADQRREHQRLVSSYGGIYRAEALEALIAQTVERLVAASERTGLKYRVVLLNSPAINAFALPGGTLYVTRGLVMLANDTSELASVLAHEMAHVVARHAAIREDKARQAALARPEAERRAYLVRAGRGCARLLASDLARLNNLVRSIKAEKLKSCFTLR